MANKFIKDLVSNPCGGYYATVASIICCGKQAFL